MHITKEKANEALQVVKSSMKEKFNSYQMIQIKIFNTSHLCSSIQSKSVIYHLIYFWFCPYLSVTN